MAKKRLTKEELERLKEHAKVLYLHENIINPKALAERVGTSGNTISKWVVEGKWANLKKKNWFLGLNSYDNAVRLLRPYKSILENNTRLIADYEIQKSYGSWSEGEFIILKGVAFRAIGAGQSPRGSRNDEVRPDGIIVDDFDTDEDCRNPDTITQKYDWFEKALIPTRSISYPYQ